MNHELHMIMRERGKSISTKKIYSCWWYL